MRRSSGTAAPFPDLNPEALAKTHELIKMAQEGTIKQESGLSPEIVKRAQTANFAKLYGYVYQTELELARERRTSTEGTWVTYKQSDRAEDA